MFEVISNVVLLFAVDSVFKDVAETDNVGKAKIGAACVAGIIIGVTPTPVTVILAVRTAVVVFAVVTVSVIVPLFDPDIGFKTQTG